ncbi:MAG: hypothetical protein ABI051_16410 [Vicinamibacterales bacterium]
MAKRQKRQARSGAAESIGAALGRLAARIEAWRSQRIEIGREIQQLMGQAQGLFREVMQEPSPSTPTAQGLSKGKGGRPKGYKMSAATKAKLRAAWKRRKAAAAGSAAGSTSSEPKSQTQVRKRRNAA